MMESYYYSAPLTNMDDLRSEHHRLLNKQRFKEGISGAIKSFRFQALGHKGASRSGILMERLAQDEDFRSLCFYIVGILDNDKYFPVKISINGVQLDDNAPSALGSLRVMLESIRDEIVFYLEGLDGHETKYDAKYSVIHTATNAAINDLLYPAEQYLFGNSKNH